VASSFVIGCVWQFTLQWAQRHNQISKIGDIFGKINTRARYDRYFSAVQGKGM
jgi:hypothetical protein